MLLIFDLDGTLYQTKYSVIFAVNALFDELNLPRPEVLDVLQHIGKTSEQFLRSLLPSKLDPVAIALRFQELEREAVVKTGILYPDVPELLRRLKSCGHTLCICSNGSLEYIELVLESKGIRQYFSRLYSAKFHASKALLVREIIKSGDCAAIGNCAVMIGDTSSDINAALKNKLPSAAALYGYGDKSILRKATLTAKSPEEISSCVARLDVFSHITEQLVKNGRRVIGINGIDASGKTTFTESYARYLNHIGYKTAVIHLDDYHNPLALRRGDQSKSGGNPSDDIGAYYSYAFNYAQLIEEVLEPMMRHGSVDKDVLCLNLDTDQYENTVHYQIDSDTVVLIEGVLLFRPPISCYLQSKIFLQIGFGEMLRRARIRDVPKYGEAFMKKYTDKYIPVQKRYLKEYAPDKTCDILIDNSDFLYPKLSSKRKRET
jgi:phosphoglycolate phosphatase